MDFSVGAGDYANEISWSITEQDASGSNVNVLSGGALYSGPNTIGSSCTSVPTLAPTSTSPTVPCTDTDNGATDSYGDGCSSGATGTYDYNPAWCGGFDDTDISSMQMRPAETNQGFHGEALQNLVVESTGEKKTKSEA